MDFSKTQLWRNILFLLVITAVVLSSISINRTENVQDITVEDNVFLLKGVGNSLIDVRGGDLDIDVRGGDLDIDVSKKIDIDAATIDIGGTTSVNITGPTVKLGSTSIIDMDATALIDINYSSVLIKSDTTTMLGTGGNGVKVGINSVPDANFTLKVATETATPEALKISSTGDFVKLAFVNSSGTATIMHGQTHFSALGKIWYCDEGLQTGNNAGINIAPDETNSLLVSAFNGDAALKLLSTGTDVGMTFTGSGGFANMKLAGTQLKIESDTTTMLGTGAGGVKVGINSDPDANFTLKVAAEGGAYEALKISSTGSSVRLSFVNAGGIATINCGSTLFTAMGKIWHCADGLQTGNNAGINIAPDETNSLLVGAGSGNAALKLLSTGTDVGMTFTGSGGFATMKLTGTQLNVLNATKLWVQGALNIQNIPTNDTGLAAGDIYRTGTALHVKT